MIESREREPRSFAVLYFWLLYAALFVAMAWWLFS